MKPRKTSELSRKRLIPNALTAGNLLCGVLALGAILTGHGAGAALLFVGAALTCDLLDGRAARALGADNAFGAQLDSLADLVSFGVVPAVALYDWRLHEAGLLGAAAACVLVLAAAARLARFNITASPRGRITGLAVTLPAAIGLGAAAIDLPLAPVAVALAVLALAGLMISPWSYRSFKDRSLRIVAIPVVLGMTAVAALTGDAVAGAGLALVVGGVAYALSAPVSRIGLELIRRAA